LDAGDIRTAETFAQLLTLQSSLSTAIVVYCNPPGRLCLHSDDKTGIGAGVSAEASVVRFDLERKSFSLELFLWRLILIRG